MGKVLGRVITGEHGAPRAPDACHRVRVPRGWLTEGATIEVVLPRNLTCARCEGGGCDACDRSGAITVRGRADPPDLVPVNLPAGERNTPFVIRIPDHGGLPAEGSTLARGHLLLRVEPSSQVDPSVRLFQSREAMARLESGVRPVDKAGRGKLVTVRPGVALGIVIAVVVVVAATLLTVLWRP